MICLGERTSILELPSFEYIVREESKSKEFWSLRIS